MPVHAKTLAAATLVALTATMPAPAYADWGSLGHVILNSLVREAAHRVVQRAMSRINYQPPRQTSNYDQPASNYYHPPQHHQTRTHTTATAHHSSTAPGHTVDGSKLRYPTENAFVPPPPPIPVSLPSDAVAPVALKNYSSADGLVPPAPPNPSIWSDLPAPHAVMAKKQSAEPTKESISHSALPSTPPSAPDFHAAATRSGARQKRT